MQTTAADALLRKRQRTQQRIRAQQSNQRPPQDARAAQFVAVERGMLSRLLYANPVCLLSTWSEPADTPLLSPERTSLPQRNIMTISWLTPVDNHGKFFISMNATRYSYELLRASRKFVLSLLVESLADLALRIGGCSGRNLQAQSAAADKFSLLGIAAVCPGFRDPGIQSNDVPAVAVPGCAAHIVCSVLTESEMDGHAHMICKMDDAFADGRYWNGKQLQADSSLPALLSFLGTKQFARIVGPITTTSQASTSTMSPSTSASASASVSSSTQ